MKNTHLLPTEKPSRLGYLTKKGKEVFKDLRLFDKPMPNILDSENQNIYITYDEEIKVGEYVIDLKNNEVFVSLGKMGVNNYIKKIILTTDQDLIAYGVQAIDDNFLEWFVKNPSCKFVEVDESKYFDGSHGEYIIIIPQEEPKQETLEEAAEKYARKQCDDMYDNEGLTGASWGWETSLDFIAGAKWQAERMYSEEDFKLFARQYYREIKLDKSNLLWDDLADKCLEQFKKK